LSESTRREGAHAGCSDHEQRDAALMQADPDALIANVKAKANSKAVNKAKAKAKGVMRRL
tara:strand:+ start:124 stop:303 length:180 start_codon:yes stop_codon:yes gene_type:complete